VLLDHSSVTPLHDDVVSLVADKTLLQITQDNDDDNDNDSNTLVVDEKKKKEVAVVEKQTKVHSLVLDNDNNKLDYTVAPTEKPLLPAVIIICF
jgi:hypothetical protein